MEFYVVVLVLPGTASHIVPGPFSRSIHSNEKKKKWNRFVTTIIIHI